MSLNFGETKNYLSFDTPCSRHGNVYKSKDIHTPEFFNAIVAFRLPNNQFEAKSWCSCHVIDKYRSVFRMCNETRLIVTTGKSCVGEKSHLW